MRSFYARFLKKELVKIYDKIHGNGSQKIVKYMVMTEKQARKKVLSAFRDLVLSTQKPFNAERTKRRTIRRVKRRVKK